MRRCCFLFILQSGPACRHSLCKSRMDPWQCFLLMRLPYEYVYRWACEMVWKLAVFNVPVCLAFYAVKFSTETLLSSSNFLPLSPHGVCLFFFYCPLFHLPLSVSILFLFPIPSRWYSPAVWWLSRVFFFFFLHCFAVSPASLWPMLLYAYAI